MFVWSLVARLPRDAHSWLRVQRSRGDALRGIRRSAGPRHLGRRDRRDAGGVHRSKNASAAGPDMHHVTTLPGSPSKYDGFRHVCTPHSANDESRVGTDHPDGARARGPGRAATASASGKRREQRRVPRCHAPEPTNPAPSATSATSATGVGHGFPVAIGDPVRENDHPVPDLRGSDHLEVGPAREQQPGHLGRIPEP